LKITPEGAYQYGSTKDANTPIWFKGFTPTELEDFHKNAVEHYKPIEATLITRHEHYVVKPDHVWERFYAKMLENPETVTYTQGDFRKWIMADYLTRAKPVPRAADLNRYAFSLYLLRNKRDPDGYVFSKEEIPGDYV